MSLLTQSWNHFFRDRYSNNDKNDKVEEEEYDEDAYKPSFFDEISRQRSGGIDVSQHSKNRRKFGIHTHEPTASPKDTIETSTRRYKLTNLFNTAHAGKASNDNGQEKPMLKVGIVLPRQIFQQRKYQTIIRNSLGEIAQEKCLVELEEDIDDHDQDEDEDESTLWKRSTWSRKSGGLNIGLGSINASTKQSVFRSAKNSILMRKPPLKSRRKNAGGAGGSSTSLLEHVKEKYDFVWNAATFRLDDDSDSVNFGDLVVSPPPSGKSSAVAHWAYMALGLGRCIQTLPKGLEISPT